VRPTTPPLPKLPKAPLGSLGSDPLESARPKSALNTSARDPQPKREDVNTKPQMCAGEALPKLPKVGRTRSS
jgi:hypothetical protein